MSYPGDETVKNALEDDYQLELGDRMMEEAHKKEEDKAKEAKK